MSPFVLSKVLVVCMVAVALLPYLPYGYYVLLRWVSCGAFSYLCFSCFQRKNTEWIAIYAVLAGLYNPFFPAHLGRTVWSFANVITIGVMVASFWRDQLSRETN